MNAVVICIDSFDHGVDGYQNPAPIAPGLTVQRAAPVLTYNYAGNRPKHIDIRKNMPLKQGASAEEKRNWKRLKGFNSDDYEE